MAQRISWEISIQWFCSTYCALSSCRIWINSFVGILWYKFVKIVQTYIIVWLTMDLKLPTWPIGFFEKFHLGDFYQPILPYLAARFQKILYPHSAIQACIIMEYNSIIWCSKLVHQRSIFFSTKKFHCFSFSTKNHQPHFSPNNCNDYLSWTVFELLLLTFTKLRGLYGLAVKTSNFQHAKLFKLQ